GMDDGGRQAQKRLRRRSMRVLDSSKSRSFRGVATAALAMGAVATGAFAIGVLTIGRLLIRGVLIEKARFRTLEIEELAVKRLNAGDVAVTGSLTPARGGFAAGPEGERAG